MRRQLLTEEDTLQLAAQLARVVFDGAVIFLHGPLGAGKTTFARGFLQGLGYQGKVKSPTYTLVEPYEVDDRAVCHVDLYRLTDPIECEHMGIRDYFTPGTICIIEWPEKGVPYLPQPDIVCQFGMIDAGRELVFEALSPAGDEMLRTLCSSD